MSERDTDRILGELFKENAPAVNDALLRERVNQKALRRKRSRRRARSTRVVAVAVASVILAVGVAYGAHAGVNHFRGPKVVVVLTDSSTTSGSAATTSTSVLPITTHLPPTTLPAEDKGTNDLLASYTTGYAGAADRQANVRLATRYATDVLLAPGEEYDLDKQIGPRTAERGWKLAPGITGPTTLEDVLGGGIRQVATTLFNAVGLAGLEVIERHNTSVYIAHYPKGRDASITGGGKDLRFVNDTQHYLLIKGSSDGITTTIEIYGTKDGRTVSWTTGDFYDIVPKTTVTVRDPDLGAGTTQVIQAGQVGEALQTHRLVTMPDGTVLHDDTWTSVWPMYPDTIAVGTKGAATTP
jgi:hypothetical protein